MGDAGAWSKRIAEGQKKLVADAMKGIRGMPAKGGKPDLSIEDFSAAVVHMVNASGGKWAQPDAKGMAAIRDETAGKEFFLGFARVILAMIRCPRPIVTRVQGKVVGGGVGVVAASDYVIATDTAQLRLSELAVGIGPFVVGPAIERKIGPGAFSATSAFSTAGTTRWSESLSIAINRGEACAADSPPRAAACSARRSRSGPPRSCSCTTIQAAIPRRVRTTARSRASWWRRGACSTPSLPRLQPRRGAGGRRIPRLRGARLGARHGAAGAVRRRQLLGPVPARRLPS